MHEMCQIMTMSNYYTVKISNDLGEIDVHVLNQAIQYQLSRLDIVNNKHDLMITNEMLSKPPRRIGELLDIIEKNLFDTHIFEIIKYQDYTLNWQDSVFTVLDQDYILSERERDLLTELILAQDAGCQKNYLLNKIWGFKADLETHALETQIYRLRQKIEKNPENPEYLMTMNNGYKLA